MKAIEGDGGGGGELKNSKVLFNRLVYSNGGGVKSGEKVEIESSEDDGVNLLDSEREAESK